MKILLACLMCLVLGASECFAISGGPVFGGGQLTITGSYAGVFVPIPTVLDPGPPPVTQTDNSLVLFTLSIPKVGLTSGTTAVFRNGFFYSGTILGSADPDTAKLTGVVDASFTETPQSGTVTTTIEFDANGKFLNTKITANTNPSSSATARIRGRAVLTYRNDAMPPDPAGDSGGPIQYKVHGFKQSSS